MPLRVRNIEKGYWSSDGSGNMTFHPIRSSWDYDPERAGETGSRRSGGGVKTGSRAGSGAKSKAKGKAKSKAKGKAKSRKGRKSNPSLGSVIPGRWTAAKVRRVGGRIQVAFVR